MTMHSRKLILRAVAVPARAGASPPIDPIYTAIEKHQKADRDLRDAVRIEDTYEDNTVAKCLMDARQLGSFAILEKSTSVALDRLSETSLALVTTKPTTIPGIGAVCRYVKARLLEEGTAGLILKEGAVDDTWPGMATFCDTIAAATEAM
jgi:hypothetical protein